MDFYRVLTKETKQGTVEVYPDFIVDRTGDLMIRGGNFYAVWDEENHVWSTDVYDVRRFVDRELEEEAQRFSAKLGRPHRVKSMRAYDSGSWKKFLDYVRHLPDNATQLDENLTFENSSVSKNDYVSKRVPYALDEGDITAWDELVSTLYAPEERAKIEWAIGAVVSGDSKWIQKFLVFYGPTGTGKSTILNIVAQLFQGYTTTFDGKALGSSNGTFATEAFKEGPLVAIQHDGDLSRIDDNTRLNSIIAHEELRINEKYRPEYTARINAMLFMGSNQPVKISDSKSGIIRRLIDVHPTGVKIPNSRYNALLRKICFELGAIACRCLQVYKKMGANYYGAYRPLEMMFQTDIFFNFIEAYYDVFKAQDVVTLIQAYKMYREFCDETGIEHPMPMYKMREELRNYFNSFEERGLVDEERMRSIYRGFNADKFKEPKDSGPGVFKLVMDSESSLFDRDMADQPAQLAKKDGTPAKKWANVKHKLSEIDTRQLHYVKVPENHIVIDFDLQAAGTISALDRNLEAASTWPPTYAEISRSGEGVHLHYQYFGDVDQVAPIYADGIEIKVYKGDSSLRRCLSRCNSLPVSVISAGLPLREKKEKMLKDRTIKTEVGLRKLIERNLRKEIHPGTKPSIDFIKKILDEAYEDGVLFDVTDMRPRVIAFANNSSNQAVLALKTVKEFRWKSTDDAELPSEPLTPADERLVFFDVEVYPNLFIICWKFQGADEVTKMVNPKPHEVEDLFSLKLVGFYNRRYDNHILYAASMGTPVPQLFRLSSKLIEGGRGGSYGAAYSLSYADIWDFASEKKSLKKWEVELGLLHMELDIPWDSEVPVEDWPKVATYCENDVRATEALFSHLEGDYAARQILAELSGLTVNDTTQAHTAKIIFGDDKNPQREFVYTDLSTQFPGYEFNMGKSSYRGEDPGEGGYVYAEPGIYEQVALLDVASMHPTSIEILNLFGRYTERYSDLKRARMAIKRSDYESARTMLDGKLDKFLGVAESDPGVSQALAYALKIVVNIVYGLTSAKFDNPFRDNRNVDNIVAKRGALFMIDLKKDIQQRLDSRVIHIKTDSVKIPNAQQDVIAAITVFGSLYGYEFDHEVTYDKFCLVNDAVYVARKGDQWTAVGAQFQHPYVFKTLFSGEELTFDDFCEARSVVKGAMYLDISGSDLDQPDHTRMRHVGKTGLFVPVLKDGGVLYRVNEDKYYAVAGTKGHLWMEAHIARDKDDLEIDMSYFEKLRDSAVRQIEQFGSFDELVR